MNPLRSWGGKTGWHRPWFPLEPGTKCMIRRGSHDGVAVEHVLPAGEEDKGFRLRMNSVIPRRANSMDVVGLGFLRFKNGRKLIEVRIDAVVDEVGVHRFRNSFLNQ